MHTTTVPLSKTARCVRAEPCDVIQSRRGCIKPRVRAPQTPSLAAIRKQPRFGVRALNSHGVYKVCVPRVQVFELAQSSFSTAPLSALPRECRVVEGI